MTVPPLVAEATRRAAVVWVALDGRPARLVWHVWHDGAAWLVVGGREQQLPGADDFPLGDVPDGVRPERDRPERTTSATVSVRSKDRQGSLLLTWIATVTSIRPGSPEWDAVIPLLQEARLNAVDPDQAASWARESTVLRLTPT